MVKGMPRQIGTAECLRPESALRLMTTLMCRTSHGYSQSLGHATGVILQGVCLPEVGKVGIIWQHQITSIHVSSPAE